MDNNKQTQVKEEMIDQATLETIKKELIKRRDSIQKELNGISDQGNSDTAQAKFPDYGDKIDESVQEIDDYTTNIATEKVLEATLRDIDSALERIEKSKYGICKYCGEPINKKRLLARPVASACVKCKTKLQSAV